MRQVLVDHARAPFPKARWRSHAVSFDEELMGRNRRLMRQVLVDHARARRSRKRGGGAMPVSFDEELMGREPAPDLVRLDEALRALAETDQLGK